MRKNDHGYTHLRIELSASCNLSCKYCRSSRGSEYQNEKVQISKERIFNLIDEAEEMGFEVIVFTGGGETFVRKDLFEIIEYGNLSKIVLTNGTLLDESNIQKLKNSKKLSYVKISFDGFEAQEELRGKETLEKILRGIELLEANNIPFAINTVLTSYNVKELLDLYEYIKTTKAFGWGVYSLIDSGDNKINQIKRPEIDETVKVISKVINRYIEDGKLFNFEVENLFVYELLNENWEETKILSTLTDHPCAYQLSAVTVRLNGDVSQCSRLQSKFGNIYNNTLKEILLGKDRSDFLLKQIKNCSSCEKCNYAFFCAGGCIGRKQIANLTENEPDYTACEYARSFEKHILTILPETVKEKFNKVFNLSSF